MENEEPTAASRPKKSHPFWRAFWLSFLVASLAYAWYSFYVPSNDVAWAADFATAQQRAAEADKPVMLFFTADWCVPCRIMKREIFADADAMRAINAAVVPVMLDEGDPDAAAVFTQYDVRGTPVTVFTNPDGSVIDYAVGGIGKDAFLEMMAGLESETP